MANVILSEAPARKKVFLSERKKHIESETSLMKLEILWATAYNLVYL